MTHDVASKLQTDPIAYWNGPAAENWVRFDAAMDRNLGPITDALFAFAAPSQGEHVLDVGCGAGGTSLRLAAITGPSGTVTGVDVSAPLLARARERAAERGLAVTFVEADAARHVFSPRHDLVLSRFGVMFFQDLRGAFENIRRALAPAGRVRFVCWRSVAENEWARVPVEAIRSLLKPMPAPDPRAPGPFVFADPDYLRSVLAGAGFRDVTIEKLDTFMDMGTSAEDATLEALHFGPLSRALAEVDAATRDRALPLVRDAIASFPREEGGIRAGAACWLAAASG
jgi:SAM-dependent methyltransferase